MDYFVNPTVNVAMFAPLASSEHGADMILAGCRDEMNNKPVKAFNSRTGEIVHEFKFVETSCLSLDVSKDGHMVCMGDTTGVFHMDNINYIKNPTPNESSPVKMPQPSVIHPKVYPKVKVLSSKAAKAKKTA